MYYFKIIACSVIIKVLIDRMCVYFMTSIPSVSQSPQSSSTNAFSRAQSTSSLSVDAQLLIEKVKGALAQRDLISETMQTALADEVRDTVVSKMASSLEDAGKYSLLGQAPLSLLSITTLASSTLGSYQNAKLASGAAELGWRQGEFLYGVEASKGAANANAAASVLANRTVVALHDVLTSEKINGPIDALTTASSVTSFASFIFQGLSSFLTLTSSLFTLYSSYKMIRAIDVNSLYPKTGSQQTTAADNQSDASSGISMLDGGNEGSFHPPTISEEAAKTISAVKYLLNDRLNTSFSDVYDKLVSKSKSAEAFKAGLDKAGKKALMQAVASFSKQMGLRASKDDKNTAFNASLSTINSPEAKQKLLDLLYPEDKSKASSLESFSGVELYGLLISYHKECSKQEQKFSLVTSDTMLEKAKALKESDLLNRLQSSSSMVQQAAQQEAMDFLSAVKHDLKYNMLGASLGVFISIVGGIGTALSAGFSAGVGAIAGASLILCSNAFSYISDWMTLSPGLKNKNSLGRHDVFFAKASMVLSAIALVAAVITISVFSMGTAPLIFTVVGGALAVVTSGYVYAKTQRKQTQLDRQKPSLLYIDRLTKELNPEHLIKGELREIISRLPREDLQRLCEEVVKQNNTSPPSNLGDIELSERDQILYGNENFGREFFQYNASDPVVLSTLLDLYQQTKDMGFRHLHDTIVMRRGTNQIYDRTWTGLSDKHEKLLFNAIYDKRLKTKAQHIFDQTPVKVEVLRQALAKFIS